jgi:DNA-binding LytR/AlgR family response regulator
MMRVLLVDDEPLAIEGLRLCCVRLEDVAVVGEASHADEARQKIAELQPDLVLLDIQMPGGSGLALAAELKGAPGPEVVFVTAYAEYATDAFDLSATDYLLKPVRRDRLAEAVSRARRRRHISRTYDRLEALEAQQVVAAQSTQPSAYTDAFWIRQREGLVRVDVRDIQRVEASRDYALLFTQLKTFILRITMNELERKLDPRELVRVHRSAFVRPAIIQRVEGDRRNPQRVHTRDGAVLEVGASYGRRVAAALGVIAR